MSGVQQLGFPDWDLPEEDGSTRLSADEIQARMDVAQALLENPETWPKDEMGKPIAPYWFGNYVKFMDQNRIPFRAAVLAAWLGTPKSKRWPKTQDELADLLGLSSDRQFSVWRKRNERLMNELIQSAWRERVMDGLADSVDAMLEVAARADYKGNRDRELHFKLAEVLKNTLFLGAADVDWSKMTFDEKMQKIRELGGGEQNPQLKSALNAREQAKQRSDALSDAMDGQDATTDS